MLETYAGESIDVLSKSHIWELSIALQTDKQKSRAKFYQQNSPKNQPFHILQSSVLHSTTKSVDTSCFHQKKRGSNHSLMSLLPHPDMFWYAGRQKNQQTIRRGGKLKLLSNRYLIRRHLLKRIKIAFNKQTNPLIGTKIVRVLSNKVQKHTIQLHA